MASSTGEAPYHAHVYYGADERSLALSLSDKLRTSPPNDPLSEVLYVGELRDHEVGPHITSQFEIHFCEHLLPLVEAELMQSGLSVLIHPLTRDDLADHTYLARWIGRRLELDLTVLSALGENREIARFGQTDF